MVRAEDDIDLTVPEPDTGRRVETETPPVAGAERLAWIEHRLRTRVTVARGWIDLVLQGRLQDSGEGTEALHIARRQLTDLEELLREAGGRGPAAPREGVELRDVVEATLRDYAWATTPPLERVTVRGEPWRLTVERSALQDAVLHLLDNVAEHTPPGTELDVVLDYGPDAVELAVEDAGPGFPARAPEHSSRGAGLHVVEQLAASMGASMARGSSRRLGGAAVRLSWARPTGPAPE